MNLAKYLNLVKLVFFFFFKIISLELFIPKLIHSILFPV